MSQALRVGWIGTGVMGAPMAGHLLAAGYPVTCYSRTKSKAEGLLAKGAKWADTPADVTRNSDIIFAIVGFPEDVRETFLGAKGIVPAMKAGQICVDMTTSPPSLAVEIAAAAKKAGGMFMDAPVSGGQAGAENAKLTIMVGGEKAAHEKVLPLYQKMGANVSLLGAAGAGQHCKVVNQIIIAGNMLAVAESVSYAKLCGIDPAAAIDAVSKGAASSWAVLNLAPRILKDDYAAGFFIDHFVKDLGIALAEAENMKLPLPMVALARQLYIALQAQGHGRLGTQAITKAYEQIRK